MDEEQNLVELKVVGITYHQIQKGAHALILREVGTRRRISVVVGVPEAQAIAVRLNGVIPPRPLSHDLMVSMMHGFGIELNNVLIYDYNDGIFRSQLTLLTDNGELKLDSRTSDAIALALRTGCRIYTTAEVMEQTSFLAPDNSAFSEIDDAIGDESGETAPKMGYDALATDVLQNMLENSIRQERYERAAELKRILDERGKKEDTK